MAVTRLGVTQPQVARYTNDGMFADGPPNCQFASARVLDPLSGVSTPLPGSAAIALASQLIR
jgi:hypothetical protein